MRARNLRIRQPNANSPFSRAPLQIRGPPSVQPRFQFSCVHPRVDFSIPVSCRLSLPPKHDDPPGAGRAPAELAEVTPGVRAREGRHQ
jgi:hypothetical protein